MLQRLRDRLRPPPALEPAGLDFGAIYPSQRPELIPRAYRERYPVAQSTETAVLVPANSARRSLVLVNVSSDDLYLAEGPAAAPVAGGYTLKLSPGQSYVTGMPDPYVGVLAGVWSGAGSGFAQITEGP